jgi:hypothetical protein
MSFNVQGDASGGLDATDHSPSKAPVIDGRSTSPENRLKESWPSIVLGIILAGWAYPVVIASGYVVIGFVAILGRQFMGVSAIGLVPFLLGSALIGVLYALFVGMIGMMWTFFVSLVTLPIVHAFVRSLQLNMSIVWLGAVAGGLVGFVAMLPLMLEIPGLMGSNNQWSAMLMLVLGPGLTTILGQIGGGWGGWRAVRRAVDKAERHRALVAIGWRSDSPPASVNADPPIVEPQPRLHFRTRHLLWLCVWISLLLSVIRLSGVPFEFALPLLVGWGVFQAATLCAGWVIVKRLVPGWQSAQERRST